MSWLGVRDDFRNRLNAATGTVDVINAAIAPQKFAIIFECALPVARNADTLLWARRWHDLDRLSFGDAA